MKNKMGSEILVERIGEKTYNTQGVLMEIIGYRNAWDCDVRFESGGIREHIYYKNVKDGLIKDYNYPTVYNRGFLGYGEFLPSNGLLKNPCHMKWANMFDRCYGGRCSSYFGCEVNKKWYNFQEFAKWFYAHEYEIVGEKICLDKDIKVKENKQYSEDTCLLVPFTINQLFIESKSKRNNIGLGIVLFKGKYRASISRYNKNHSKDFDTLEEAVVWRKQEKEKYIKEVVLKYKNKIPEDVFNIVYNYKYD